MRAVVAAVRRHHPAQLDQLGGVREHPRRVGQPAAHPGRALSQPGREQVAHPVQLGRCGGPVLGTDHQHPQRALRDQVRRVAGDAAAVQPVQVLADAGPVEVEVVRLVVPAGDLLSQRGAGRRVHRCVRQAVLAEHLAGHALAHLRGVLRVRQDLQIGMCMHVDEAGRQHQPGRIDPLPCSRARLVADSNDAAVVDEHVCEHPGRTGAVDRRRPAGRPASEEGPDQVDHYRVVGVGVVEHRDQRPLVERGARVRQPEP